MKKRLCLLIGIVTSLAGCSLDKAPECVNKSTKCTESNGVGMLAVCIDGDWKIAACPGKSTCKDDKSCSSCEPQSTKCKDGKISTCKADGNWGDWQSCPDSGTCSDEYSCNSCVPNATSCINGAIKSCTADRKWGDPVACDSKLCKDAFSCSECEPGVSICSDGMIKTCTDDGSWTEPEACPLNQACKNDHECKACTSKCENNKKSGIGQVTITCDDGTTTINCENVSCNPEGTECGDCNIKDMNTKLSCSDNDDNIGVVSGCYNGKLVEDELCEHGSCHYVSNSSTGIPDASCGECVNKSTKCFGDDGNAYVQVCLNGIFDSNSKIKSFCPSPAKCNSAGTMCEGVDTICITNDGFTVSWAMYEQGLLLHQDGTSEACPVNYSCKDRYECGDCNIHQDNCMNDPETKIGHMRVCNQGTLVQDYSCETVSCDVYSHKCGECKNNSSKCEDKDDGSYLQKLCYFGSNQVRDRLKCPDGAKCNSAGTMCEGHKSICHDFDGFSLTFYDNGIYKECSDKTTGKKIPCNAAGTDCSK